MNAGYIDTSALLALVFSQPEAPRVMRALRGVSRVVSSDLLICETLSACCRERAGYTHALKWIERIDLIRVPVEEDLVRSVLDMEYLRGADLHHLATALVIFDDSRENVLFASLDRQQSRVAGRFGFRVMGCQAYFSDASHPKNTPGT